ncbi:hypothetical protein [Streptomyces sp. NPDC091299]|uniref:hypothetical protein n=1 Tax=Streptomyces sp. NPDC091299 TaxID=3155302 RepID=UPI0034423738
MDNYTRAVPGSDLSGDPGHGGVQPMKDLKGGCAAPNTAAPLGENLARQMVGQKMGDQPDNQPEGMAY